MSFIDDSSGAGRRRALYILALVDVSLSFSILSEIRRYILMMIHRAAPKHVTCPKDHGCDVERTLSAGRGMKQIWEIRPETHAERRVIIQIAGKVVVVTGGASGIGRSLYESFHRAGAATVMAADIDPAGARVVATPIGGAAFKCDVGKKNDIAYVIEETERQFGPIALFCSNAGILVGFDPLSTKCGRTLG